MLRQGKSLPLASPSVWFLSPVRLPVPPLQQVLDSFELTTFRTSRTVLETVLLNLRFFAGHDDSLMPPSGVDSVD